MKVELSCFELLLSSHQPLLHQHLLDAGLPALLYATQWLMTTYACPFPVHVRLHGQGFLPTGSIPCMQTVAAVPACLRACRWGVSGISRRRCATCALHAPCVVQLLLICCVVRAVALFFCMCLALPRRSLRACWMCCCSQTVTQYCCAWGWQSWRPSAASCWSCRILRSSSHTSRFVVNI